MRPYLVQLLSIRNSISKRGEETRGFLSSWQWFVVLILAFGWDLNYTQQRSKCLDLKWNVYFLTEGLCFPGLREGQWRGWKKGGRRKHLEVTPQTQFRGHTQESVRLSPCKAPHKLPSVAALWGEVWWRILRLLKSSHSGNGRPPWGWFYGPGGLPNKQDRQQDTPIVKLQTCLWFNSIELATKSSNWKTLETLPMRSCFSWQMKKSVLKLSHLGGCRFYCMTSLWGVWTFSFSPPPLSSLSNYHQLPEILWLYRWYFLLISCHSVRWT